MVRSARPALEIFYGKKPEVSDIQPDREDYDILYNKAMSWAHENFDLKELKKYFCEYIGNDEYNSLPEHHFSVIGKQAWIMLEGGNLAESNFAYFNSSCAKLNSYIVDDFDTDEDIEITSKMRELSDFRKLQSSIDIVLLSKNPNVDDVRYHLCKTNCRIGIVRLVKKHYENILKDAKKERFHDWDFSLNIIISEFDNYINNYKLEKNLGKTTNIPNSVIKTTKNVKIKKQDQKYNLVTVSPTEVVKSKVAITFNTKTRRVSVFVADNTLDITGTTIKGYNESSSYAKTLRKPDKDLSLIKNSTTFRRVELILNERVGGKKHEVSGRLNSDTLILKTF